MSSKKKKSSNTSKNITALAMQEKIKIEKWFKSLNFTQRHYLERYAEEYYRRIQEPINEAMDCCISAALIQRFEDLEYSDILDFQDFMLELMTEHANIDKGLKARGIDIMKNKKDLEPKVRARATELIKEGKNQKAAIEILAADFATLSKASLTNAFKKVKQEIKDADKLKAIATVTKKRIDAGEVRKAEDVIKENESSLKDKITEEHKTAYEKIFNEKFDEDHDKVNEREEEIKQFVKDNSSDGTLKIIKKETVAIGKFGEYTLNMEGVKVGIWNFKNISDVNRYKKMEVEKLKRQIAEIEGRAAEAREMFFI